MVYHLVEPYLGRNSSNTVSLSVIDAILECSGKYTSERDTKRKKKAEEAERDNKHMTKADVIVFFVTNANAEARNRVLEIIGTKPIIWLYEKGKSQELANNIAENNTNIFIGSYRSIVELRSVIRKLLLAANY